MAPLFREVNQDIHAKYQVHAANVDWRSKIHLRKANDFAEPGFYLLTAVYRAEMRDKLTLGHTRNASTGVNAAFGGLEGLPAYVSGEDFDFPGISKGERVKYGDRDGIGLFPSRATSAPDAQCARIPPELLDVKLGQNMFLESFKDRWITEKSGFLS